MNIDDLTPYVAPASPAERPACAHCRALAPAVWMTEQALCYLCAHDVLQHGVSVGGPLVERCSCARDQIYPGRFIAAHALPVDHELVSEPTGSP